MMRLRDSQKPTRPQRATENKNTRVSAYLSTINDRKRSPLQPTYASTEIHKATGHRHRSATPPVSKPSRFNGSEAPGEGVHSGPGNNTEKASINTTYERTTNETPGKADVHTNHSTADADLKTDAQTLPTTSGAGPPHTPDDNVNNLGGHVTTVKVPHPKWQPMSDPKDDHTSTLDDRTEILETDKSVQMPPVDADSVGGTIPSSKRGCSVEHRVRFGDSEDVTVSQEISAATSSSLRSGFGRPGFRNVTCPTCRKFYTARSLEFHAKACLMRKKEEMKEREALESMMQRSVKGPTRPPGKLCYICGRRYTRSSWTLHESKCVEQWQTWNSRLPKQLRRGDLPFKPNVSEEDIQQRTAAARSRGKTNYSREDALDDIMYEASVQNALPLEYL
ncbi:hypothetical protein AAHC03_019389 [Spirometra sp. Aus1]